VTTPTPAGQPIDWSGVERLFAEFNESAFRLETLQCYREPYESEGFKRFIASEEQGLPPPLTEPDWWRDVRTATAQGKSYRRVHIVTEPLTDYVRFECATGYRLHVTAGEDIRIIPVIGNTWPHDLPMFDYWLFDSRLLLLMKYGPEGALRSTELTDSPDLVAAASIWRDRALERGIPFAEYETRFDEYMRPH
jgi:hypothetical protein